MIRLERVTEENYKEVLNLKVREDQAKYVSSNAHILAKAYVFYDRVTPFVVYHDDLMVGLMLLRFNRDYNNYFLWQLMIDERFQGRGYGKEAMKAAIEWMKMDERCNEIVLTYIEGNEHAKNFYTKLGFQQMGEVEDGEVNMRITIR